jgi:hypothetical protein
MPDSSITPPDDRPDPPGDPTMPVEARKDTLAASGGTDFRHGRFEPGERLGSRYRIVARLGEGGMGEVYRADDLELGQSVALKFLPERVAADESWLRRFRNEVRTARQIAHPNVCRIYDIGEQAGHVFLSMEYVDGEDLSGVLRRLGRPSREKAIEIARQICLGLAAAHDNMVLHRDLKPANIMIDGRGRVRITDFGLAGFLAWAVISGLSIAGVVVLIRLLVRHPPTSAVLSVLVIVFLETGLYFMLAGFSAWGALTYGIGMGVCLVWLYTRVGVLAAMVFFFVMRSIGLFTVEFDAWSTSYNVALLASVLALAAYGFWISLAGQPIFKDMLAEPQPAAQ